MRIITIILITLICSCSESVNSVTDTPGKAEETIVTNEKPTGTWIYFSQTTFMDINKGIPIPNVRRKLNAGEEAVLDSVIAGYFDPPADSGPKVVAGCYWPKHVVQIFDSASASGRYIHVCFECGRSKSTDSALAHVSMDAWEIFFRKMGWPVLTGYPEFFARAHSDSLFRTRMGAFQF